MKKIIRSVLKLLVASALTFILYLILYFLWGAILNEIKNDTLRSVALATLTSVAYAFILFFILKRRHGVGTDEVLADYKEKGYTSLFDDVKIILKRDRLILILIGVIIITSLLLNKFDSLIIGKKTVSVIVFPFLTMSMYATCFPPQIDFLGYIISLLVIYVCYIIFTALYRRGQYKYWLEKEGK